MELKKQNLQEEKESLWQFHRAIFAMVLPIAFQNFMTAAVSASDAVILGFLEQEALSAVSLAGQVMGIFTNDRELVVRGAEYLRIAGASYVPLGISQVYLCIMKNSGKTAKRYARESIVLTAVLGACSSLLLFMIRPFILSFAALTPDALRYLSGMLLINCYFVIAGSVNNMVIGGIFCAGGQSRFGCVCDMVVLWLVIIPLAAVSAFCLKLPVLAVYLIICLDEGIKVPVVLWYYRKYTWARNLTH